MQARAEWREGQHQASSKTDGAEPVGRGRAAGYHRRQPRDAGCAGRRPGDAGERQGSTEKGRMGEARTAHGQALSSVPRGQKGTTALSEELDYVNVRRTSPTAGHLKLRTKTCVRSFELEFTNAQRRDE